MTKRRLQLNAGAIFVRLALVFFVLRQALVWLVWMRPLRARPGLRLLFFLFRKWATPHSVLYALLFAAAVTGLLQLLLRLVVAPLVKRWHAPWTDDSAGLFHLGASERVLDSSPARLAEGRRWVPGTLVRSNLRLWFFPRAHDAEIWSRPISSLHDIHLVPAPRIAWGYVQGWPERLALKAGRADANGNAGRAPAEPDGVEDLLFALPDPHAVLAWFAPPGPGVPPTAAAPSVSSPRSF